MRCAVTIRQSMSRFTKRGDAHVSQRLLLLNRGITCMSPRLRGPLQPAHQAAPRMRSGAAENCDDQQRRGRPRVAEAHRQQEAAAGPGEPVQGCQEHLQNRDRAGHVVSRLRCTVPHTMYAEKPMQGGGLVVDYQGWNAKGTKLPSALGM